MASASKSSFQLTALALALASIGAQSAPISWTTDASGDWSLPANWTPTGLPDASSDVTIVLTGLKTITHGTGNDTINTLSFDATNPNPNATLLVNGGSSLTINAGGTSGGVVRADNGTVRFNGGTFTNKGFLQTVNNGSMVFSGTVLAGGTLTSSAGGTFAFTNSALIDASSNGPLNNNGSIVVNSGQNVYVQGLIAGNGTITQQNNSDLRINNGQSLNLQGTGALTLTANDSRVFSNDGAGTLTNGVFSTIQGQGQVGLSQTTINNAGLVTANVAGQTLIVDPRDGEGGLVNTGTLRAENGGTLQLYYGNYNNQAGTIAALAGSSVVLNNADIQGGSLATTGTGTITAVNSSFLDGTTHGAITNTGALILGSGQNVYAQGSLVDNHGITQQNNSDLRINNGSNLALSGSGALTMTAADSRVFSNDGAGTLTNSAGYTIQGQGQVGVNNTIINNAGVITANVNGQTLVVDPHDGEGGFVNTGTLRAENGGTLQLYYGNYNNQAGTIAALAGSAIVLNNADIQGGSLTTSGTGTITAVNSSFLDGATHGAITNTGALILGAGQNVYAQGSLVDNHGITQQNNSDLRINNGGNLVLSGSGALTMTAGDSRVFSNDGTGTLTNSAGYTIQGLGQLGVNNTTILNAGVITANVNGQTLLIDPRDGEGGFVNTGTLRAENGGTLQLNLGNYDNHLGTITASNGSVVSVSNGSVQGGLLTSAGSGTVSFTNNASLDGTTHGAITNAGSITFASGQNIYAQGTIVDNGTIAQQNNDDFRIGSGNNLVLAGTGVYSLQAGDSRIFSNDGTGTLTNGAGHTIQGLGQIGLNQTQVTNAGTIAANVAGQTLNLVSSGATVNQSTGTLLASNGGTLYIDKAVTGTGTIQTASGGTVVLNQGATTGRLVNDANLAIATNNVTVSADYSNANFGNGNAFAKHAGITGSGQILASGNVAQAVTGSTVTNGTSASPTLTIGNVRVGGTTVDYQVANTGTSGPAIRGAIQTGANGGNITDARLSGSGVTAGNFGPVAAGASSGYAVTFTASQAGALAPLTGQAVHIANNFDNVGEQTLNIALASGAAAYNAAVGATTPSPVTIANQRIGGTASQALTVSNTAAAGNFSEALNASFAASSGAVTTNGGSVSNIAAGASNTGALAVGVSTASAGAKTGNVTIGYQTDGTGSNGHSGLAAIGAGSQTIAVSGNVFQTAAGNIVTAPLNFGTVQVGQNVSRQLSIANTATGPTGFVEDLNAAFGAAYGTGASRISGSGAINGLVAGATGGGMTVSVDTSSAGTVAGGIAVNFASAGAVGGVSNGLGTLAIGSSNYGVAGTIQASANVVNQASPVVNNAQPIALGNVRIGAASPVGTVSVTNQATSAPQAALSASIAGNAPITASGSFSLLNPGATDASSLHVGFDTSSAGAKNGTATISFVSDASNIGNCAPNCQMALASQDVAVTGAVYRLANPVVTPSTITVAGRVGSASPTTSINVSNASPDAYTEGLSVTRGATSAGFASSGAVTNLAAGGSSGAIGVTLNTAMAGTFTGTQALNYVSTGAGTTGAADLAVGSGTVALNGKVYTPAAATLNTPAVDFGIVHVGDSASRAVSVTNSAAVTALNDVLVAQAVGATGPFSASGTLGAGLAAGQTGNSLAVGLGTTAAGVYGGQATFSAASHDGDLSDAALANLVVGLTGQVNNYAADAFALAGGAGTLTRTGSTFVLDYGTVQQGSATRTTTLVAGNTATGPADLLDGSFEFADPADFGESGFSSFANLLAGQSTGPLTLSFATATVGAFLDTITLHGVGHNASGYSGAIGDIQLVVRGVVDGQAQPPTGNVPEPDSLLLLGLGLPLLFRRRGARVRS